MFNVIEGEIEGLKPNQKKLKNISQPRKRCKDEFLLN
jgi:hypothetical protein